MSVMKNKSFIITIDTEGDNLWSWKHGDKITTENVKYLPRFQALCDKFGFKPVWLTNYEMASDPVYVAFSKKALREGRCEIGMHLHAANNPPLYNLEVAHPSNFPYLIEYPQNVVKEKISILHQLLEDTYEEKITTHRAGRWAMDKHYMECLVKLGYKIDCSVTPGEDWSATGGATAGSGGSNYSACSKQPFYLDNERNILEVPVSIRTIHYGKKPYTDLQSFLRYGKHRLLGYKAWLRPHVGNLDEMQHLAKQLKNENTDYLMFMLHSSEMMPGGSPTFKTEKEIEGLYSDLRVLFEFLATFCEGRTLKEYLQLKQNAGEIIPIKEIF